MRFARSPANVGDVGHHNGRGSGSDSQARRRQRARVLFLASTPGARGYRSHGIDAVVFKSHGRLGIECLVGHPAQIRAAAPRKQKNDRRDAELILKMLVEGRFPAIWLPSKELQDLRALLRHRHQWVRMRTRIQNALQSIALANGLRRGTALWSHDGQSRIASLSLAPHTAYRRREQQAMYEKFEAEIEKLTHRVEDQASKRPGARLLMSHPGVGVDRSSRKAVMPVRGCQKRAMVRKLTGWVIRLPASLAEWGVRITHHGRW